METVDVLIIGAGVVGLAIADRIASPHRETLVIEQHDGFGRETSSRNSEVIHCGMYYAETLLKTTLCVRGNPLLYELCESKGIPYRKTGKIMVAASEEECASVHGVLQQGQKNGVQGLRLISRREIQELEVNVSGILGLFSPESGIVDSHQLMSCLERSAKTKGATVAYGCTAVGVRKGGIGFEVDIRDATGELFQVQAERVVNSAGLHAERIASMAGIDCDHARYRVHPCKGEYFRVSGRHRGKIGRLVYPVPSPVHLGAHAVLALDGSLRIGPNSFYVDALEYSVDPSHQKEFHENASRLLPFLTLDDLTPDTAGIRAKLYGTGEPFRDFVIREESDQGLPGLIDLVGIESPGLTSCLAIAERVEGLLEGATAPSPQ
jgi:L-2-hydroxyglutarate oxidase LhgO